MTSLGNPANTAASKRRQRRISLLIIASFVIAGIGIRAFFRSRPPFPGATRIIGTPMNEVGVALYPSASEQGVRSARALKRAVAEREGMVEE